MTKEQHFYGRTYRVVKKLEESKIAEKIFFYLITVTEIMCDSCGKRFQSRSCRNYHTEQYWTVMAKHLRNSNSKAM